jgi:hypothetical protein
MASPFPQSFTQHLCRFVAKARQIATTTQEVRRSRSHAALVLAVSLAALAGLPAGTGRAHASAAQAIAQGVPPTLEDFKRTLSRFGQYVYSERYGNVWRPSSFPAGWHPYPACNWVYDRTFGWTYDDRSEWGRIIHHYGRWAHDADAGWVWVPGAEWSPAWVAWRTGGEWSGWAPMPPTADQQETTLAAFEADKQWTFVETAKLADRCAAETVAPGSNAILQTTKVVKNITIVKGIAIYVMAPPSTIAMVDFDTGPIAAWPSDFLGEWISLLAGLSAGSPLSFVSAAICEAPAAPQPIAPLFKSTPPPAPLKKAGKGAVRKIAVASEEPPRRVVVRPPVVVEDVVVVPRRPSRHRRIALPPPTIFVPDEDRGPRRPPRIRRGLRFDVEFHRERFPRPSASDRYERQPRWRRPPMFMPGGGMRGMGGGMMMDPMVR